MRSSYRRGSTRGSDRRRKKRRRLHVKAVFFIMIAAAILSGAVYLREKAKSANPQLGDDLCRVTQSPASYHAVLIDRTDPYNETQRASIKKMLETWRAQIPTWSQVTVFAVSGVNETRLTPELSLCNPPAEADRLIQNPERVKERWNAGFVLPLERRIDELIGAEALPHSPIMEMIQSVAISAFPEVSSSGVAREPRELVIISDMLHNTEEYSHYRDTTLSFRAFRDTPYFQRIRADLRGVVITIFYARRDGDGAELRQGRDHVTFWEEYFMSMGATLNRVRRVSG